MCFGALVQRSKLPSTEVLPPHTGMPAHLAGQPRPQATAAENHVFHLLVRPSALALPLSLLHSTARKVEMIPCP